MGLWHLQRWQVRRPLRPPAVTWPGVVWPRSDPPWLADKGECTKRIIATGRGAKANRAHPPRNRRVACHDDGYPRDGCRAGLSLGVCGCSLMIWMALSMSLALTNTLES